MPNIKVKSEDWIKKGIELFSQGGIEALNVEKMAKILNCTKGSFYHHFKSREDYIDQILEYYYKSRKNMLDSMGKLYNNPVEKLSRVLIGVFKNPRGLDFEFQLRKLAETNEKAKIHLNNLERERITYVSVLLNDCGVDDSQLRAEMIYHYYLGWYQRNKFKSLSDQTLLDEVNKLSILTGIDLVL
ncbi:MAG: TetR/AcrR family transcriptional regulator [Ignavibacteriales bacterium]|jgi:AcrR family transcriptional regulator|nr:MAG: TetR/AcrR family transcriptional regulator [Ignavibacteriales bacterium]